MSFELILPFFRPIRALLLDDDVSEIMGNPDGSWSFERQGKLAPAEGVRFDSRSLQTGLEVIANHLGKLLDHEHPLLNVQLPDGSRLAAVLPPVVRPGPAVTIRKFRQKSYTIQELLKSGSITEEMAAFLGVQVRDGKTLLISGGTGSGKTTLLNALANFIPIDERIILIEDTAELRISHPNLLAAECQVETIQSKIDYDTLLRASLRWRPDRIILGEVRGHEARTLLDSFNTGHGGSITTIHANSPVAALNRFGELAMRSHQQNTRDDLAVEIAGSVHYVVQVRRFADGRKVSAVIHVTGYSRQLKAYEYDSVYSLTEESSLIPSTLPRNLVMPLLEVQKITHVTATIAIEQSLASAVDKYATFIHATADEVVNKALEYVFSKDKEFQKFLASDQASSVTPSLHVQDSRNGTRRPRTAGQAICR